MRHSVRTFCVLAFAASGFAANQVATAASSEPFVLRGAEVPVAGAQNWPVFGGDHITAGTAQVIVKFSCNSRVRLNPGAEAQVTDDGSKLVVHLLKGDLTYKLSKNCPLAVAGLDGNPIAAEGAGTATLVKTAVVVAPIVGGVAAYGVTRGGGSSKPPSVSPSN